MKAKPSKGFKITKWLRHFVILKPQELAGGAKRRQSILGVYVLVHLAIAIKPLWDLGFNSQKRNDTFVN
ncbi:hypothetical protein PseudUWO310_01510 [Pseudanabaena sp. UWO310]|nr:hypothetical protein PseudUWO310_01510 [Pseudanabaena sp. UWO310]